MSANMLTNQTETFGHRIKKLRFERKLSQRKLARQVGITATYISDMERLRRGAPSSQVIERLALALETSEESLYDCILVESNRAPSDVVEIIKQNPETVNLLRTVQRNRVSSKKIREITAQIGGGDMKAIIVAAGMGARMGTMTQELPKSLAIVFNGHTLLETQLQTLKSCGIHDISIVRGYKAEKINFPQIKYYLNEEYAANNILESIFYAEKEMDGDLIISYADIWYEPDVLKRLMRCDKDIAIGVDIDWKDYYLGRKDHPITQAENVIFDSDNRVVKIGKISAEKEEVHGEFIGMMRLTRRGCEILKRNYHRAKTLYSQKPFGRASLFQKAYLTDLLQEMADIGVPIHCEIIGSAWKEIDTVEDFEKALNYFEQKRRIGHEHANHRNS